MRSYNACMGDGEGASLSARLAQRIAAQIEREGGWLPFDRFMALALYAPGLGYYANDLRKFGAMPASGSDFVTAPEMSAAVRPRAGGAGAQALQASGSAELWEFGAGSGALAAQLLALLGDAVGVYHVVELSATLRQRQRSACSRGPTAALARCAARAHRRRGRRQRGARCDAGAAAALRRPAVARTRRGRRRRRLGLADRPTALRRPAAASPPAP
jgi:hypothetical protein